MSYSWAVSPSNRGDIAGGRGAAIEGRAAETSGADELLWAGTSTAHPAAHSGAHTDHHRSVFSWVLVGWGPCHTAHHRSVFLWVLVGVGWGGVGICLPLYRKANYPGCLLLPALPCRFMLMFQLNFGLPLLFQPASFVTSAIVSLFSPRLLHLLSVSHCC